MTETNGIFVYCLPQHTRVEDLWDVFNYDENCKVDYVLFPLERAKSKAYVHFTEYPESILKCDHKVLDSKVYVEPAAWPAFSKCMAEVDPMIIASIPEIPECIAALEEDFHVVAEYSPETGKFMIEGSFEQLACAQVRLQDILHRQLEIQKRQLRRLSSRHRDPEQYGAAVDHGHGMSPQGRQHHPVTYDWTASHVDAEQHGAAAAAVNPGYHQSLSHEDWYHDPTRQYYSYPQVSAGGSEDDQVAYCGHMTFCPSCQHTGDHHQTPSSSSDHGSTKPLPLPDAAEKTVLAESGPSSVEEPELQAGEDSSTASDTTSSSVTCDLDYYVVEYVKKSQMQRVKDIEQEFGITIRSINRVCDEIVTVAFERYNPTIQQKNEQKAHRAFLALYDVIYQRIVQRTVQAKTPAAAYSFLSAIDAAYKEDVFASANNEGLIVLVGPFDQVAVVENFILKRNSAHSVGHSSDHSRGKFHPDDDDEKSGRETGGGGNAESEARGPISVYEFGGRLMVKVYSADITRMAVDVIVNAANEQLQNYAGVAGAIERAGGEELKQDCKSLIEQGGPLKVSEVVHTPSRGQLRCRHVVHTVGPVWSVSSDKSLSTLLLRKTFENVLHYSHRVLHAASVAVPAIGTGIFGVPLDVCAQSMYHALKAVADKVSNLSLSEVHLVNIDRETTQFIQSVFLQLTSSDGNGSPVAESQPPKSLSVVTEPEKPSPDTDNSVLGVEAKDEGHEEVLDLYSENGQVSALKTAPDGQNTPDEVVEDYKHLLNAAEDSPTCHSPDDEKIRDEEQIELDQCSRGVPNTENDTFAEKQKSDVNDELPLDQEHSKSDELLATEEVLSTLNSHTLDVMVNKDSQALLDQEEESEKMTSHTEEVLRNPEKNTLDQEHSKSDELLATEEVLSTSDKNSHSLDVSDDSQPLLDQEEESAKKEPHTEEVLNNAEKDNQTLEKSSNVTDLEMGEMSTYEEHHSLCSKLPVEPQMEMFMQELSLEEYREEAPSSSSSHQSTSNVLESTPRELDNSEPRSLEPSGQENSQDDCELLSSLPDETASQTDGQ